MIVYYISILLETSEIMKQNTLGAFRYFDIQKSFMKYISVQSKQTRVLQLLLC